MRFLEPSCRALRPGLMQAPTQRPNFLLLWIGVLILVMTVGLRALVPASSLRRGHEVSGAIQPPPAVPVPLPSRPGLTDPALLEDPIVEPVAAEEALAEGQPPLPGLQKVGTGESTTTAAESAGVAESGREEPRSLERLEPSPLVQGVRPHPARAEVTPADRSSSHHDRVEEARVILVSFHGRSTPETASMATPQAPERPQLEEQALVVQLAPDKFRAVLVVETQPEPVAVEPLPTPVADSEVDPPADENPPPDETAKEAARARAILAGLREWLQSREGRAELSPEVLRFLSTTLRREWASQDHESRRLLILDLDRRELTRLLAQLAERAQNRAG